MEPDEIDLAVEETGEGTDSASESSGDSDTDNGGDGDGDAATTADTDPTGESDSGTDSNTSSGDGDGDPASTGDGDGDGDEPGDGDGDGTGGDEGCGGLEGVPLGDGENPLSIDAGPGTFVSSCGGEGMEQLFSYTAAQDGMYSLELVAADADAALVLLSSCEPYVEATCEASPDPLMFDLLSGETAYILVVPQAADGLLGSLVVMPL